MNNSHRELLWNIQWTEDMLHVSTATEYRTGIGLRCPFKITVLILLALRGKKNVEILFCPKINNSSTLLSIKVHFICLL